MEHRGTFRSLSKSIFPWLFRHLQQNRAVLQPLKAYSRRPSDGAIPRVQRACTALLPFCYPPALCTSRTISCTSTYSRCCVSTLKPGSGASALSSRRAMGSPAARIDYDAYSDPSVPSSLLNVRPCPTRPRPSLCMRHERPLKRGGGERYWPKIGRSHINAGGP